jgi:uncharacterized protein with NAD-binding domain and iron-sulfur cluster
VEADDQSRRELPFIWGPCRDFNAEPLLLNRPGSLALRPDARTAIPNMFLAADYVRTETDLACMEGANEAARRAVNALLQAAGSRHPACQVWSFSMARDVLEKVTQMEGLGRMWGATAQAARAAGRVTDVLMGVTGQAVSTFRSMRNGNGR